MTLILQNILPFTSYDGVPFLMHDQTLQRTTNIHEVFPNRTKTPASMFTWAELESLNAGAWFLSVSPKSYLNIFGLDFFNCYFFILGVQ